MSDSDERTFRNDFDDSKDPEDWERKVRSAMLDADRWSAAAVHRKPSIYSGEGGWALALFRRAGAAMAPDARDALLRRLESAEEKFDPSRLTFLEGLPGNLALRAVLHRHKGEEARVRALVARVQELGDHASAMDPGECEVLYGRCGYLGAVLFLRRELGDPTLLAERAALIVREVIEAGRRAACRGWPLYYQWHGKCYFGGAHGIAGILFTLLQLPEELEQCGEGSRLVRATADRLLEVRFRSGNLPSSEGSNRDRLVHWCHGPVGLVPLLLRLAEVHNEPRYLRVAVEVGEVVWKRGLLSTKGPGLCHGIPGNGYALLALHRADPEGGQRWLRRARHFAAFVAGCHAELLDFADRPYSMFEGVAGALVFWHDVLRAAEAPLEASRFPGYEF